MTATSEDSPILTRLPAGVRCGHVAGVRLPKGYKLDCRLGQLVNVRGPGGSRYLLASDATHWHLYRRVTPDANGHARNHVAAVPHLSVPKDGR